MLPVFVINLDRSPDRLASVSEQLREAGVPFARFPAVDGSRTDRAGPDVSHWGRHFATDSMLGCALSHMHLWRHVRNEGLRAALIMEDDVRLVPGFVAKLHAVLREVPPDFDILYLGCFVLCSNQTQNALVGRAVRALTGREVNRVSERIFRPAWPAGMHCYVVSAQGARKLAATRASSHIDMQLAATRGLNLYAATPPLATQADMNASTQAAYDFPRSLSAVLGAYRDSHGISLAYYLSVPFAQVGAVRVNAWLLAFLVMGLAQARPAWVAAFFAAEAALGGPSRGMLDCGGAYVAGWAARQASEARRG